MIVVYIPTLTNYMLIMVLVAYLDGFRVKKEGFENTTQT